MFLTCTQTPDLASVVSKTAALCHSHGAVCALSSAAPGATMQGTSEKRAKGGMGARGDGTVQTGSCVEDK